MKEGKGGKPVSPKFGLCHLIWCLMSDQTPNRRLGVAIAILLAVLLIALLLGLKGASWMGAL